MITASRSAKATIAFFIPQRLANLHRPNLEHFEAVSWVRQDRQ
jgi:hypothetical protein